LKPELHEVVGATERILVRGVNWVGDSILTYSTVQRLKTFFSCSHLAILVPSYLVDLWKTFPFVDEVIPFHNKAGLRSFQEDLRLSISLRKRGFDLAVILPRSFRSAFQIYLTRIPIRIGYQNGGRSFLLTHDIHQTEKVLHAHRVIYYQKLIHSLTQTEACPSPRIFLQEEDRRWAQDLLKSLGLLDGKPLIGMNPGATYGLAKCWYPERFGELGKRLRKKEKAAVLLFGKEEEGPIAKKIVRHMGNGGIDLTGKTRLLQLAALLERCQLLVTNDTGTMHMAAAVDTPVVALFGSTDPLVTGPWGEGHVVIREDVDCSPCLKRICPTKHQCMDLITVDEVEEAVYKKLKERI
jgi:heptosyltransferase II